MFDMRYHWLSLMALFVALGLGVLIGTGLGQGGVLSEEQRRLTSQLEASLTRLREENRSLSEARKNLESEMDRQRRTVELLAQAAMRDRLRGRSFVLLYGSSGMAGEQENEPESGGDARPARWRNVLIHAGATVKELSVEELSAGSSLPAEAQPIFLNPPPNVLVPEGRLWEPGLATVVWDTAPSRGNLVLPSDWYKVRAGEGVLAEWLVVEGLRQGWRGHLDALPGTDGFVANLQHLLSGGVTP